MRRWLATIVLGVGLMMTPTLARAADETTLSCLIDNLDSASRATLEQWGGDMINMEVGKPPAPEFLRPIARDIVGPCAERHGWSEEAMLAATQFLLARGGQPGAARAMRDRGINVEGITALYQEFPTAAREMKMTEWSRERIEWFAERGVGLGYFRPDQARIVGRYLGLLNLQDSSRADFRRA